MAHIRDVRRLSATAIVVVLVLATWYLFLQLHHGGLFEWFLPREALDAITLAGWSILIVALLALAGFVSSLLIYAIPIDKDSGRAIGGLRQVQCQDCKAVFRITDTGERPLTHHCPRCKAYGVYDPSLPPIGSPPIPQDVQSVKKLQLTCRNCEHAFQTVDTGARPLRVECPECDSLGIIR